MKLEFNPVPMKKFIALAAIVALMSSCNSGDRGELVGVKGKKWLPEKPYGMTLIPGGAFVMGKSGDDFEDEEKLNVEKSNIFPDE